MQIRTLPSKPEAARAAQEFLYNLLKDNSAPLLFLASGGSALDLLNKPLEGNSTSHITLSVIDERFSREPSISNFIQLQQTPFYMSLVPQGIKTLITVPIENESITEWGPRVESQISAWQELHPDGKVIATLGMGTDGHTAGIFPSRNSSKFLNEFVNTPRLIHAYEAPTASVCTTRLTATVPLLKKIDCCIAYICGQDKLAPLTRALSATEPIHNTPANILTAIPNTTLFTDLLVSSTS